MKRIPVQREHRAQVELTQCLRNAMICHAAIPNAGKRSVQVAAMLKAEGMQKGFPDLLIFDSPPLMPWLKGVAIELKTKGNKPTPEQKAWQAELIKRGWLAEICYGCDGALRYLSALGYRVPTPMGVP